ncbi:MAG: hypothetical protein LBU89_05220, partial [Fibromonadaceae bacterium]|nr:hypothetical protein [Fibromonadaceae bacterium]
MKKFYLCFAAFLCIAICGCVAPYEPCDKARSYPFWTDWSGGNLVYIMNDSLAVLSTYRYKVECNTTSYKREDTTNTRAGLFLVNYRAKKEPLMGDTLELGDNQNYGLSIARGYFKDSSVLVFDFDFDSDRFGANGRFGFWKIGEKSIKFKDMGKIFSRFGRASVSHWMDESIIIKGYPDSHLLYPETGHLEQFNPSEEYEWMSSQGGSRQCLGNGFLSYIDDKIVCVRNKWETNYAELIVDGTVMDTAQALSAGQWFGTHIRRSNYGGNFGSEIL